MPDALAQHWPDAWFAARFLPRRIRSAIVTVHAVMHQLSEVLCSQSCDSGPGGGCSCGPEDERRRVALAILDHLWRGEPTGKAELDRFAGVVADRQLQREPFEAWIDAMLKGLPPRVATWKRLREHIEGRAEPAARIVATVFEAEVSNQATALATAIMASRLLERVRDDASAGRLTLPLDDVLKFGLSDRDVLQLTTPDERWAALVDFEAERIRTLFAGGEKMIAGIHDPGVRRAVSVVAQLERQRLDRAAEALRTLAPMPHHASLRQRLGVLPRAMRFAMTKGAT